MQTGDWVDCDDCLGKGFFEQYQEGTKHHCGTCGGAGEIPVCHDLMIWSEQREHFYCSTCANKVFA